MKRLLLVAGIAAVLAGCKDNVKVKVACEGQADGVLCKVSHTAGKATVKACFDLEAKCKNGTAVKAPTCVTVAKGQTQDALVKESDFQNWDKCDGPEASTLAANNLTITKAD